jgi:outer membrane protein, heavy metal efflux system
MPVSIACARAGLVLGACVLAGCTALPAQRGLTDVHQLVAARGEPIPPTPVNGTQSLVHEWLEQPLTLRSATAVALLNNPLMDAEYARLGLASADLYDAGRLSNPRISGALGIPTGATGTNGSAFGVVQSFTELLWLPARSRLAAAEFEQAQILSGQAIFVFERSLEQTWITLVGARQLASVEKRIARTAEAAATLSQRLFDAGNLSARELAEARAASGVAALSALQATAAVQVASAQMSRGMGLSASSARWKVTEKLNLPTAPEDDPATLQALALGSRLDLLAQRNEMTRLEKNLQLTRRYRYLGAVDVGVTREHDTDGVRTVGPNLELEVPVFNQGAGKVLRAQAQAELAASKLAELELGIADEVATLAARAATLRAQADLLREQIMPQRELVVRRLQEEVNFMIQGPFTLLRARQEAWAAAREYLVTLRDYWLVRGELTQAVGTRLPSAAALPATIAPAMAPSAPAPTPSPTQHHHGDHS